MDTSSNPAAVPPLGVPAWLLRYPRVNALDTGRLPPCPGQQARLAADPGNQIADTFGWDTVFAIPIPDVNRAIEDHKSSPPSFSYQDQQHSVVCRGNFGDWQICQGGDGANLRLAVPVSAVSGSYAFGGPPTEVSYHPALTAIVQIKLKLVPHTRDGTTATSGTFQRLVARTSSSDPDMDPVVSMVSTDWPNGDPDPYMSKYVIEYALGNWLNANLDAFAHVFAVVNLNRYIDSGQWAFCNPSYVSYAYIDRETLDTSVLGILCMTGGRTTSTNIQELHPGTIPPGSRAGFLISRVRFLTDLVLPTLPLKWPQASLSQFQVASDGSSLSLLDGQSIRLPDVQAHGSTYTPHLKGLTLFIQDSIIELDTYTEVDLGLGVTGWCRTTHRYAIKLVNGPNGQTLQYQEVQPATMVKGTAQGEGTRIFDWMLLVVGIVATIVLGALTEGAAFVVSGLILGLLLGASASEPEIMKLVDEGIAPSLDLLAFNTTNPIAWANSQAFRLDFAELNGSLQLGGDPRFV